jgi:hypothetical protein
MQFLAGSVRGGISRLFSFCTSQGHISLVFAFPSRIAGQNPAKQDIMAS